MSCGKNVGFEPSPSCECPSVCSCFASVSITVLLRLLCLLRQLGSFSEQRFHICSITPTNLPDDEARCLVVSQAFISFDSDSTLTAVWNYSVATSIPVCSIASQCISFPAEGKVLERCVKRIKPGHTKEKVERRKKEGRWWCRGVGGCCWLSCPAGCCWCSWQQDGKITAGFSQSNTYLISYCISSAYRILSQREDCKTFKLRNLNGGFDCVTRCRKLLL